MIKNSQNTVSELQSDFMIVLDDLVKKDGEAVHLVKNLQ